MPGPVETRPRIPAIPRLALFTTLPLALAGLASCATQPSVEVAPSAPPAPGMERLMGKPADLAIQLLGTPRLDRREGPARQLQFRGACILDIFYYPKAGQPALATHAEARLASGQASSPGDCLQALLQSQPAKPG